MPPSPTLFELNTAGSDILTERLPAQGAQSSRFVCGME